MSQPKLTLSETATATRLGRYALGRELGRGFSSIVFEATDTLRGRPVALKVLTLLQNLTPTRRREMSERFEREARAISALSHPAIVSIYDVGHAEDGQEFIAMERLEGETLRARLERVGPLLRAEALPLMVQIADALQYAHGRGIIHRDVKPDNIFLCSDGTAKLMDFGVAHVFADDGLTQTGTVVGSPAYMSPEQINGDSLDGRSDVFSLAVTLVEAVTGRKPFEGPNIPAVMYRILNQPPQMSGINAPALHKALERALAKTPQMRTPSAGAFAEALRRVMPFPGSRETITGTQVMPRPALSAQARTASGTTTAIAAGVAVLGLAIVIAMAALTWHRPATPTPFPVVIVKSAPTVLAAILPTPEMRRELKKHPAHTLRRTRVASIPEGHGLITEHTLPADVLPLTLATLHALRDTPTMPLPMPRVTPQTVDVLPAPRHHVVLAMRRRGREPDPGFEDLDADQAPQAVGVPDSAPHLVQQYLPELPTDVSSRFLTATVGLLVSVNEDGDVFHARVTQTSGNDQVDAAALTNVYRWQFDPAFRAGRAVAADVPEQVRFSH